MQSEGTLNFTEKVPEPKLNLMGVYLDDFGADLKGTGAEFLACTVGVLSVDHTDVGTAPRRDHLETENTQEGKGEGRK